MFGGFQVGPFQPAYQQEGTPPTPVSDVVTAGSLFRDKKKKWRSIKRSDYFSQYDFYREVTKELQLPSVPMSQIDETGNVFADEDDEIILMALTKVLH